MHTLYGCVDQRQQAHSHHTGTYAAAAAGDNNAARVATNAQSDFLAIETVSSDRYPYLSRL